MLKNWGFGILLTITAITATAWGYPVDRDIAKLRDQVKQLESLKYALATNHCVIKHGGNEVVLYPDALRGNGLIMGIGPNIKNQYIALYEVISPEALHNNIDFVFKRPGAGKDAYMLKALLASSGEGAYDHFDIRLFEPVYDPGGDITILSIHKYKLPLPKNSEHVEITEKGPNHQDVTFSCN